MIKTSTKQQNDAIRQLKVRNKLIIKREDYYKVTLVYLGNIFVLAVANGLNFLLLESIFDIQNYFCILAGQAIVLIALFLYILGSRKELVYSFKTLVAICVCMMTSYTFNIFFAQVSLYLMPIALSTFLIAPLAEKRDAFVVNLISIALVLFYCIFDGFTKSSPLPYIITLMPICIAGLLSGSIISYRLSVNTKRISYILRGLFYSFIHFVLILVLELFYYENIQSIGLLIVDSWYYFLISPLFCILFGLLIQPILETSFNIVTNTRLVELTDHNNQLIKRLMTEAPGTFNHCMAVATFAEVCANAIGENPYMARAAAYYHDMGKLINPRFFKENQGEHNPHDEILPELSTEIIRNHTTEGFELCLQARVPLEIAEITIQHHGTLPIAVFYHKAKQLTDREVDPDEYRYNGQTPKSKIAAILMICDASEAAIRAMSEPNGEKVDKLLRGIISDRITSGQFADCNITLRDLDIIRMTIINIYGGFFHQRLAYPGGDKKR